VKYGPDATDCVKFEPDGLRITLPIGYPRPRPGTGVVTDFGVKGDFEITANIEILQEPNAGLPGNPTDLKLVIVPNDSPEPGVWHKSNQNRAVLAREAAGRGNFGGFFASSTEWDPDLPKDKWGNENFSKIELQTNKRIPAKAKAKAGRLRLLRTGPMLYFFASEDADKDFVLLQKKEFSAKDLKNVRVLGSTGSAAALLDVRVTDLHVRADAFIKAAAPSPPLAAVEPAPAAERGSWLFPLALVPVFAIALALGIWMVARMRRNKPAEAKPAERAPSAIAFECPHCGKRLKAKSERAGRAVKCPQCAKSVTVPNPNPEDAQESDS
jgi:hypothetical protein